MTLLLRELLLLFLLFTAISPRSAYGFLNIESLRQSDNIGLYGSAGAKVSGASGNTDKFISQFATQNMYRQGGQEFLVIANHSYGEVRGNKDTHNGSFHLRYSFPLDDGFWSWEGFAQAEYNEFTALVLRHIYGAGTRIRLFKSKKNFLYSGVGAFYEVENIEIDPDQYNIRGNIYLSYRSLLNSKVEIVGVMYYQPLVSRDDDYRFQLDLGIEVPLVENFTLTAEWVMSYDSRPPTGIKKEDITYLTGVNYSY